MECSRAASLVDAYLDSELDPVHSLELQSHLQECARCASLLESRRVLQNALREHLPYYRAPEELQMRLNAPPTAPSPHRSWKPELLAIAALLILVIGVATPFFLRPAGASVDPLAALVDAAETDHVRSLLADHLVDVVSSDRHTVKPWFAGKLPFAPNVPDLAEKGFPLKGGRLDVLDHEPAAALVYGRDKHTINLFVWAAKGGEEAGHLPPTPAARSTSGGYHARIWSESGLNYCAISDVEAGELAEFANAYRAAANTASSAAATVPSTATP